MEDGHIQSVFDRGPEDIQSLIMKMGGLVEVAILDAVRSLAERDEDLVNRVRQSDAQVDVLEEEINEAAARIIALRAPTAGDLRTVLTVMKISANLERMGDYAKNMAKRTSVLVQMNQIDGAAKSIHRMGQEVEAMLKDVLDAYIQRDAELAKDVRERDVEVDQMYNALFREFLTHMMEDPRMIGAGAHLMSIAKTLERIGDHCTNIAEVVHDQVTGENLNASVRPKAPLLDE